MIENNIFIDIGLIIVIATFIGFIFRMMKQPLIPSFILTGILIGPFGLKLITELRRRRRLGHLHPKSFH